MGTRVLAGAGKEGVCLGEPIDLALPFREDQICFFAEGSKWYNEMFKGNIYESKIEMILMHSLALK